MLPGPPRQPAPLSLEKQRRHVGFRDPPHRVQRLRGRTAPTARAAPQAVVPLTHEPVGYGESERQRRDRRDRARAHRTEIGNDDFPGERELAIRMTILARMMSRSPATTYCNV
jgi:hypothetical protein